MKNEHIQPRFTDKELLEIFPEAKEIIPEKIREYETDLAKAENEIQEVIQKVHESSADPFSRWFGEEMVKVFLVPSVIYLDRNILRLKRFLAVGQAKKSGLRRFSEKVELARRYPIAELARSKLEMRPSGGNLSGQCPFHEDRTPSFYVYPENNSFYCFGCQESGDVIKLTMALHGIGFKDAVKMLGGQYEN